MFKDPDKQREANRKAQARFKAKGITKQGITDQGITKAEVDKFSKVIDAVGSGEIILGVAGSKPGRTAQGNIQVSKRGKDIKCFEDLPPVVQRAINLMSRRNGKIDQTIKANRTAIAVHYHHLFPDRYHSAGVAI